MPFKEKCSAAQTLLEAKGISRAHYAPLFHRALWKLGVQIPPPHFSGFLFNALSLGGMFAFVCYAFSFCAWLLGWSHEQRVFELSPYIAIYGAVFGVAMACVYQYGARKHGIPIWSSYKPIAKVSGT